MQKGRTSRSSHRMQLFLIFLVLVLVWTVAGTLG